MARQTFGITLAVAAAVALAACTVHKQDTPALTGPSELGTAITVQVSPDVLNQDGASQSLVTITVRDTAGQPVRNLPLRAEITVNGAITDFGTLSARNVVTDANGRATLIYTAPAAPAVNVDAGTLISIDVTPAGTDFGNAVARHTATIRLVPPGVISAPNDLRATFTFSRADTSEDSTILFDASASDALNPNSTLLTYTWDFGKGDTATGKQVTRKFGEGTRTVTLTVKDAIGRTGTTTQTITTLPSGRPTASSPVISPTPPRLNEPVHFDASASSATTGHRIVSYTWNWGDGTLETTAGPRVDHVYTLGGRTYVVLLTVTDETGKTSTTPGQTQVVFP